MEYRRIGKSSLKVSRICLGSNNFGEQVDRQTSIKIINKASDLGINLIDTANVYTDGKSEEIIGEAVRGRRSDVILATKVGNRRATSPPSRALSRESIMWHIAESLRRLGSPYVDIYYLHKFDPETPLEETLRTMNELVRNEKVRHVGCSNFTVEQIREALNLCERLELEEFIVVQPRYNLLHRQVEKDLLPWCHDRNLGVVSYSPLQGGLLTGKYRRGSPPPEGSRGAYNRSFWERQATEENFDKLERISGVAERAGVPMRHLVLGWLLRNPLITAPILSASRPDQVQANVDAISSNIPDSAFDELDRVTAGFN